MAEGGVNENLAASSEKNTIVFLANTFDSTMRFTPMSTLGELKARYKSITMQEHLFGRKGDLLANEVFPDNGDYYLMFNGIVEAVIDSETTLHCELKRNIARIDFNVELGTTDVSIDSVILHSAPNRNYYVTSYLKDTDVFPANDTYNVIKYKAATESINGTNYAYTFYTSVNQRGSIVNNNYPEHKNTYAPAYSTYVVVYAKYSEGSNQIPITYTFYLGADLVEDFNLRPNYKYTYNISINSIGNAATDSRIEDWGVVDFSEPKYELSNCYILNPSSVEGGSRKFKIPVERVDIYWGNQGYASNSNNVLGTNRQWEVSVIWADFDYKDKVTFTKATGKGSGDTFTVEVKNGTKGNMVVGVKMPTTNILWSWHLWITDYRPDDSADPDNILTGTYVYPVYGGEIHRYAGTEWTDGKYKESFIMDRNLGALSPDYVANAGQGSLYYQFGRKDPFPGNVTIYNNEGPTNITIVKTLSSGGRMDYSVRNPKEFIAIANWTADEPLYNPTTFDATIIWHDKKAQPTSENPNPKSIFDPCPEGWCLPDVDVWSDFRTNSVSSPTTNVGVKGGMHRGFTPYNDASKGLGLRYWPYISSETNVSDEVYYTASSYISTSTGYIAKESNGNIMSAGYYWGRTPVSEAATTNNKPQYASRMNFNIEGVQPTKTNANFSRGNGLMVRCIKHNNKHGN